MSTRRGSHKQRETMLITALIAVLALLVGFVLGRVTAGVGITSMEVVSTSDESELSVSEDMDSSEETVVESSGDEEAQSESPEDQEDDIDGDTAQESAEESSEEEDDAGTEELVDAADYDYDTDSSSGTTETAEQVTHEAVSSVSGDVTVVDVSTIEDVTLYEAVLPDGVASTLYGKTGESLFQVVIFGDSQFGNFKGTDGMAYLLSQKLHANVYNLAMGGKTASVDPEEQGNTDVNTWEETCGVSMVKAVCGLADADIVFNGWDYQKNVFNSCDFSKTDVFVIAFGVNDYLTEREMYNETTPNNYFSYFGALETMITDLRAYYPDAQIVVCTPCYAQFWESGTGAFLGDSNIVSNFYGTLYNYTETASHIVGEHQNVSVVNTYLDADIDIYSAPDDLLDGIHLTASGREKYVNLLSRVTLRAFGIEVGEGVDPDTVDWISQLTD